MVVRLTGSWRSPVRLVCGLQAGELPPEAGQRVDGIRLVGCESWPSPTLSETASHPWHVGDERTSLPGALRGVSGIICV